jgi:hypothetical protein
MATDLQLISDNTWLLRILKSVAIFFVLPLPVPLWFLITPPNLNFRSGLRVDIFKPSDFGGTKFTF